MAIRRMRAHTASLASYSQSEGRWLQQESVTNMPYGPRSQERPSSGLRWQLKNQLRRQSNAIKLLWVDEHKDEMHYAIPAYSLINKKLLKKAVVFVALRFVKFSHGQQKLITWCSNDQCPNSASICSIFEGRHFVGHAMDTFMHERQTHCTCSNALIHALGGSREIYSNRQHLSDPCTYFREESLGINCHYIPNMIMILDRQYSFISTGISFKDWGAVYNGTCKTCPYRVSKYCGHIKVLVDLSNEHERVPDEVWLSSEQWEHVLCKEFDTSIGKRKLTCKSRRQIPEDIESNQQLMHIVEGRKAGSLQLPDICYPDRQALCLDCQECNWSEPTVDVGQPLCIVFLPMRVQKVYLSYCKCQTLNCNGKLEIDGQEYAILCKSNEHAFAYELLYAWCDKQACGGITYFDFWRDIIMSYKRESNENRKTWMNLRTKVFIQATLDFIQLQHLDFASAFRCNCNVGLIVDGITLGFHKSRGRFEAPWTALDLEQLPQTPGDGTATNQDPIPGSHYNDRTFITDGNLGKQLQQYAQKLLDEEGFYRLKSTIEGMQAQAPPKALEPFIQQPTCEPHCRKLFYNLGTPAPAAQTLKPIVFPVVAKLVDDCSIDVEEEALLSKHCPHLYTFIKHYLMMGSTLHERVNALLKSILQVSELAFQRAGDGEDAIPSSSRSRRGAQHVHHPQAARDATLRSPCQPITWSHEEAYLRTGVWSGLGPEAWACSDMGGNDVYRRMNRYIADLRTGRTESTCQKFQGQRKKLVPGCMFYWCLKCRKCVFFNVLRGAESPRTIFETLYTRCAQAPPIVCMDNGCNVHQYMLNREPAYFKNTEFFIDQFHWKGHKNCSLAYNTDKQATS